MRNRQSITNIFSLLCFLGAAMLLVLDFLVPNEDNATTPLQEPSRLTSDSPAPFSLSLFDVQPANNFRSLGDFQTSSPPAIEPREPIPATVHLVVSLSERTVGVYRGQERQAQYPVGIGQTGWETPEGVFEVIETRKNPAWEHPITGESIPPGPANPLGDRWIGFWTDGQVYIGFHGTPDESSIGVAASHGCLRLANAHIRELFDRVEPGTPVIVRP